MNPATQRYSVRQRSRNWSMAAGSPWQWDVELNGQVIDTYSDAEMAHAYVAYMNARQA